MHAGIYLNPQTTGPTHDAAIIDAALEHVKLAERVGYKAVWVTEHAFTGYNAYSDPLVLGAHLAALAPSLHIGFSVAVAALHHPIRFAIQAALLDNLCKGKLIPTIGTGIGPDEFNGFGLSADDRKELIEVWTDIVVNAWTHEGGEAYTFDTPWWKGKLDGRIIPAPIQKPFPPLARATLTPHKARELGRLGRPLLLSLSGGNGPTLWNEFIAGLEEGVLSDAQREKALEWSCFTQQTYISDRPNPIGEVWEYSKVYLSKGVRANFGFDRETPEGWERRKHMYRTNTLLAGPPQAAIDKLAPWAERGMRHVMVWAYFGEMPPAMAAETIQRFGEEVIPVLERIGPRTPSPAPVVASAPLNPIVVAP
jgi:alkanesulfonate monooxygenase SsuD/methylene tetrahydromethanopterin reductase-like flavin-dependent oxidoreductase (luciferase family)